ncbi:hypothetical protein HK405_000888 [Cladochytrium tenue]|nr:hypothetical protein HK405_000888 [Cladochytrium tenue]
MPSGSSPAPAAAATSPPPTQTTPAARAFLAAYARQHAGPVRALATAAQVALGLPPHAVVLALLYARRLLSASVGRLPAALSTPSKVLLAGLVLADAHLCDATVPMRAWAAATAARGGGAQVAAIKAAALDALQFGIAVDAATYSRWMMSVDAFFQSVASDDGSDAAVVAAAASETS